VHWPTSIEVSKSRNNFECGSNPTRPARSKDFSAEGEKQMIKCLVLFFSDLKGFGFLRPIPPDENLGDLFFHHSEIQMEGYRTIKKNTLVTCDVGEYGTNRKRVAKNIRVAGANTREYIFESETPAETGVSDGNI
jgi:cold shock protein